MIQLTVSPCDLNFPVCNPGQQSGRASRLDAVLVHFVLFSPALVGWSRCSSLYCIFIVTVKMMEFLLVT